MRLPYLQVDQDALVRARTMAGLLGIPEAHGIGIAVSLFAWGLEMANEVDLTGQIPDEDPAELVAAAIRWDGDKGKLYRALTRVGFIEVTSDKLEEGYDRLRGLDRYETVLEERRKDRDRKIGKKPPTQVSGGIPAESGGSRTESVVIPADSTRHTQTQTQTQTQKKEESRTYVGNVPSVPEKPTKPDELWDGMDFRNWAQAKRVEEGLAFEPCRNERDVGAWFTARLHEGYSVQDLRNGFYAFAEDPYWANPDRKPALPFKGFMSQWQKYVTRTEVRHAS